MKVYRIGGVASDPYLSKLEKEMLTCDWEAASTASGMGLVAVASTGRHFARLGLRSTHRQWSSGTSSYLECCYRYSLPFLA